MKTKHKKPKSKQQYLGTYSLPNEKLVVGDLRINGESTLLKLHSDEALSNIETEPYIKGTAYSGECITLIDCFSPGSGQITHGNTATKYYADIFPHYIATGRQFINPDSTQIAAISFTTCDLTSIFYDFDAFGTVSDAKSIIDAILEEPRKVRTIEAGDWPQVLYFTGKNCISEVATTLGKVSINHRPRHNMGGPDGAYIKNRIEVSIRTDQPVTFRAALEGMYDMASFLSVVAGRIQRAEQIYVTLANNANDNLEHISIHPSFRWMPSRKIKRHNPHPGDIPLDPIRHRLEFETVLSEWLIRHSEWRTSRTRYLGCIRKTDKYDTERLVAAANMFDILPASAVPKIVELPRDLAITRDESIAMFRKHPASIDRNSALSALGRLGQPSLPKKVAHRVLIVEAKLKHWFPDLQFVASIAVKCRNFFVHGSANDFEYEKVDALVPFLTDALEFIFAASDLIEAGWDAQRWGNNAHGWGHNFARFRSEYSSAIKELRLATTS